MIKVSIWSTGDKRCHFQKGCSSGSHVHSKELRETQNHWGQSYNEIKISISFLIFKYIFIMISFSQHCS